MKVLKNVCKPIYEEINKHISVQKGLDFTLAKTKEDEKWKKFDEKKKEEIIQYYSVLNGDKVWLEMNVGTDTKELTFQKLLTKYFRVFHKTTQSYDTLPINKIEAKVMINGKAIAEAYAKSKALAKERASEVALEVLSPGFYDKLYKEFGSKK